MALKEVFKLVPQRTTMDNLEAGDLFIIDAEDEKGCIFFAEADGELIPDAPELGKAQIMASWLTKAPVDSKPAVIKVET